MMPMLFKDYNLYLFALLIGFAISMGLGMMYTGRWQKRRLRSVRQMPQEIYLRLAGLTRRMLLAGRVFISLGLLIFGLLLFADVSIKGTLLDAWTLGFVLTCTVVTLLCAIPTMWWFKRLYRRLERRRGTALADGELHADPHDDVEQKKSHQRPQSMGESAPLHQTVKSRPQPKEAREE